jgi:coproporphyrinogen III oxidase
MDIFEKKRLTSSWFRELRDRIFIEFEKIEKEYQEKVGIEKESKFNIKKWNRGDGEKDEGGGEIGLMYGNVFESVGVNISTVYGKFEQKFAAEMKDPGDGSFWASGISLVAHMCSPKIPAVHFNTRFICTQSEWFGGGGDLTPLYEDFEDTKNFHQAFKNACDKFNPSYYPEFKKNCDEYFYLHHRKEPRGIGGIFYDYLNSGNWNEDFKFTQEVGLALLDIYPKIVRKHLYEKFTEEDRDALLIKRGRYVEFNLLYDRGTRFGFMTNGNPEAILVSMPPVVKWHPDKWKNENNDNIK